MCKATRKSTPWNPALTCEVEGDHPTATDEYGTHEIHSATWTTTGRKIEEARLWQSARYESIENSTTWDDIEAGAVLKGDGTPAHTDKAVA